MLEHNALMNRLSAVETLGSTTTILTDKTGTLTRNKMQVTELHLPAGGAGGCEVIRPPAGEQNGFQAEEGRVDPSEQPVLRAMVEVGVLCNNANIGEASTGGDGGGVGDPVEVALLKIGRQAGIHRKELLEEWPETREEAFDRSVKMMATYHGKDGRFRVTVKGAPEKVLESSADVWDGKNTHPLDENAREDWLERNRRLAERGLRVLAAACKQVDAEEAEPYENLTFLGLIGMQDPPRSDVGGAIESCRQAGIEVVMVTGDQPTTAGHVAREIGLVAEDRPAVIEGRQLHHTGELSDEERRRRLDARIFARVSPEQKLDLIELHQADGHVVAMTGDGVNDAPALKKADIGIAMGRRGTQVAQEAADMVLKDDTFNTIVVAVAQGRTIFDNIRKFILFLLSGNVGEIMIVAFAIVAGTPLPLLPLQILYLNMIGDVFPALALALGHGEAEKMQEPPRDPREPVLTRGHWLAVGGYGLVISAAVLAVFAFALRGYGMDREHAVTISFLCLSFSRLWHVFNMRRPASDLLRNEITCNPYVWAALAVCVALLLLATYVPVLAEVLQLVHPGVKGWSMIAGFSLLPLAIGQLTLWVRSARGQRR
jgi:Ca2+-transporting ATPase